MSTRTARLDPLAVRRTLRESGLRARHSRSQNFLADPDVLEAILDVADPKPGDRILEIGPGLGILTGGLLDAGAAVTAIEIDRGLAAYLGERFEGPISSSALTLIEGDALDLDLTGLLPPPYKVVANLPYHISSPTLHRLLGGNPVAERIVLMLQAEVADRIAAPPGRMSYLSVFVQYHADVQVAVRVPAEAFEPPPNVESAVVVLVPRPDRVAPADPDAEDELWRLVQAGFRERRKMLRNVLGRQLPYDQARIDAALAAVGIAGDRRPQTLSVEEWLALRAAFR
ncbi:MAG: 16S rRNA (adenine(1518)-N(6)/adenine(1519)-N(6))-dimethyltransferase RsmA [Chloroflexota bacterium]